MEGRSGLELETKFHEDFIIMEEAPMRTFSWLKSGYYHPFSIANSVLRRSSLNITHGVGPAGGFVHLVIEYLMRTGRFQIQITVYLEKMDHS